jgi:hypothetical protein
MPRRQPPICSGHHHAFADWQPLAREGLVVGGRRGMLKAGLAGMAGLSLPDLVRMRTARGEGGPGLPPRSVILLWMTGGPSQIDTWDPKPDRPIENRGPFATIPTKLPGVRICEHLPRQAAILDRITLIRSVDAQGSNHEPNTVFQTGNRAAEPRVNPEAKEYPSIAAVVARHRGANRPGMPANVGFWRSPSHIAFGGALGQQYDPLQGNAAARLPVYDLVGNDTGRSAGGDLFTLADGLDMERLGERRALLADLDRLRRGLDLAGTMTATDAFHQQAVEMLTGDAARRAFDLSLEPEGVRDRYGPHLWCRQALLARRLVEAGVAFVTIDLSYHTASGTWDNHGDNIPPYGGISRGLKPLLPLFDHLFTTLVLDLEERGLAEQVLVIAMGEFGRTPTIGTQGSTDGRDHWPGVMSMALAGGGLRHGQVIGASDRQGGAIAERPVGPGDLAATLYRFFGLPADTQYVDLKGRPRFVIENGTPIAELF